jgi:PhoPQ-activated pathogenicity-related protein
MSSNSEITRQWHNRFVRTLMLALVALPVFAAGQTALDRYVAAPDPNYKYELARTTPGHGYTQLVYDLTSQKWRTDADVDHPVWHHWLTIIVPDKIDKSTGFLYLTGGSITSALPAQPEAMITSIATSTNTVTAELRGIPNEPLLFNGETQGRSEDAAIVYTWDKFLRGGDETWPLRLPMTKAAVRAMDTITSVMKDKGSTVDRFVVSGASKRGWTTWTTGIVDKRVVAIIPIVIDCLNFEQSLIHHYRSYGTWAPAVADYTEMKITDWIGTEQFRKLIAIEDPFSYKDRLTIPKYIVNSAGDQYFLPDSSQYYWKDLKGEKYLRYVPNTKHDLNGSDARESVSAFYAQIVNDEARPQMDWSFEKDGSIRMKTTSKPSQVVMWQANNPTARDFRLDSIGKAYTSTALSDLGGGVYIARIAKPSEGWTAFFMEATFPTKTSALKLTSGVRITPDTLPSGPPPMKKTGR